MTIHKEGRKTLFYLLILLAGLNIFLSWRYTEEFDMLNIALGTSIIFYLLILQFFRSPTVKVDANENHILAPADGTLVVIENVTENEYFKDERIQLSIFMSPLNVHVNRTPAAGLVKYFKYHAGKYLVAWHPKSSTKNERTTMVLELKTGAEILVRQIAGAVARRIKWYVKEGQIIDQGSEYGFIKFGSRLDVFLPLTADIKVRQGQKTRAGKTILAELKS